MQLGLGLVVALAILVFIIINAIRILPEYERGVVFRLGRLRPDDYGPGLFFLRIPILHLCGPVAQHRFQKSFH